MVNKADTNLPINNRRKQMTDIAHLKDELTLASRILANEDLAQGFGHISVRVPGTDRFLIPRLMSPALVQPQDIIQVPQSFF